MSVVTTSLPESVYSIDQCRQLDRAIINAGTPGIVLMKNAARAALAVIDERWPKSMLTVMCGAGNNAGDGYMMAAIAAQRARAVQVYWLSDPQKLSGDAQSAYQFACREGVAMAAFANHLPNAGVLVDALMGTGATGPLRSNYKEAIEQMNRSNLPVLAVDLPSGVEADTGAVADIAVRAAATVTFVGMKLGLLTGAAKDCVGELYFAPLVAQQISDDASALFQPVARRLNFEDLLSHWPERAVDTHKGRNGHVLIIGGDRGMGGAVILAAEAAARAGAGLVTVATRVEHCPAIIARLPSIMARGVEGPEDLQPLIERATTMIVGPGLGLESWGEMVLAAALHSNKPLVIDADALTIIARRQDILPAATMITPHPGEAARLLGMSVGEVQSDRARACLELRRRYGGAALLKGAGTLIAHADQLAICPYGNPGMAVAGMGDTLTGIIAALWAQGLSSQLALELGVCLHSKAADIEAQYRGSKGLLPTDILPWVNALINGR